MAEAHNHHYVPQGYLRGFADGLSRQARVRVYDLEQMKTFVSNVRNVASKRDFNRLEGVEGFDPNALEDSYGKLEDHATIAIRNIVATESFAGDDRMYVLNLMALLVIRNPRMRETWSDFMSQLWKMTGEMVFSNREVWEATKRDMIKSGYTPSENLNYEAMRDFVKSGEYDVVTNRLVHIRLELETWEKIIHILSARKWRLGILPDHTPDLVTCDHPVSLVSLVKRPDTLLGNSLGYGIPNTAVVFPLTRRLSLWGTFEGEDETKSVGWLQAALFNSYVVRNADRQIYAHDDKFEFMWGREKRLGSKLIQSLNSVQAKADTKDGIVT